MSGTSKAPEKTWGDMFWTCNICESLIGTKMFKCVACPDTDFCETCVPNASNGEHADHLIIPVGEPRSDAKRDRVRDIEEQYADVEIPASLKHIERAQLFFAHGNKHRATEPAPYKTEIRLLADFKLQHFAKDALEAMAVRVHYSPLINEIVATVNSHVGSEADLKKLSEFWNGQPAEDVVKQAERRKICERLAMEELGSAMEAMEEEGHLGLDALRHLSGQLRRG